MATTRKVTIFEGPDGGGKTTAAKLYAEKTGAVYIHHSSYPALSARGLGRIYVESLLPALLGYQDAVLDRSWWSEPVYAHALRGGLTRLDGPSLRMLDRLALRCAVKLVLCLPPLEAVTSNYLSRRQSELPRNIDELEHVYEQYACLDPSLPVSHYNYELEKNLNFDEVEESRTKSHLLAVRSAGNLSASYVLVGEEFAHVRDGDALYQWPFASFSRQGCSWWLTKQLTNHVEEAALLWVNVDQDFSQLNLEPKIVFALGTVAHKKLRELKIKHIMVPHPQSWKRFHHKDQYPLIAKLGEIHG